MKAKAGLALVVLGVAVFAAWEAWTKTRHQVPLDVPLSLEAGRAFTEDFRLNLDGLYLIEIAAEKNLPADTLHCLMGLEADPARCKGIRPVISTSWIVFREGRELRHGTSFEPHSAPDTHNLVRVIGEFPGEAGRTYQLQISVTADGHQLASADPRLRVAISSLARTDLQSASVLVFSISFICVFFGAILLGIEVFARSSKPRDRSF